MKKEDLRARSKAAREVIPSAPPLWYSKSTNIIGLLKGEDADGEDQGMESGVPDWTLHRPGGISTFLEFKSAEGCIDLSCWRDNQRWWYFTWPARTGHEYYLGVWLSWDKNITRADHDKAFYWWLPASEWLATEQEALDTWGIRTVYAKADRAVSTRRQWDLETRWQPWALARRPQGVTGRSNQWVLPETHPLFPRGSESCHLLNTLTRTTPELSPTIF